jgi:hypothetical protein
MKNWNTIIFLLSCYNLFSQEYLRPLVLDGIQPSWQQFIVDSTTLSDPKKHGFDHLTTNFILVEESVDIAYFIHWDLSERYQGAFIQKRNVRTGNVLWTSLYNLTNSERHEFPRSAYLNDEGNLVIVNLRNNDPEFSTFVWFKASPALRIYDKNNGQLLKYIHADEQITQENQILFYTGLRNIMFVSEDNKIIFIQSKSISDTTYTIQNTYDYNGKYITLDTILYKRPYKYYGAGGFNILSNGQILSLLHSNNQNPQDVFKDENFNKYSSVSDIYDGNIRSKKSTDLTGVFPHNWKIEYSGDNGQEFWLLCGDSTNVDKYTDKSSKALVFVSTDGTVREIIDFGDNKYERIYAVKENNTEGAYIVTQDYIQKLDPLTNEHVAEIIIWKSDGNGKLVKLHTINYRDDRTLTISSVSLIGKNMVLGTYMRKYENISDIFPKYQMKGLIGYNIDLISKTNEIGQDGKILKIFPNPTSNIINIEGLDHDVIIKIIDQNGKILKNETSVNKQINIHTLPAGVYILDVKNKEKSEFHKIVKIE